MIPRDVTIRPGDATWPARLADLHDPPLALHVRGRLAALDAPCVTIVGARRASRAGLDLAHDLARALAAEGVTVVSGMAAGVDTAAHRGALASGATVAVLGSGLDVCYPASSRDVYRTAPERGVVLSEFALGTEPRPHHFPQRNRLLAALAHVVVVVEGGERSGSRITADLALDLGRDVMAVPRDPAHEGSWVPNELLKAGAAPVTGAADVLDHLALAPTLPDRPRGPRVPDRLRWLWNALASPVTVDEIVAATERGIVDVLPALLDLELRGHAVRSGARYQRRKDPAWLAGSNPAG